MEWCSAMIGGDLDESTPELHSIARTHRRFYLSLILRDLINEQPIRTVATKFSCPRGAVQQLAITARGFAATSATFCRVMGWSGLAVLLDHYTSRLDMGVRDDLVELARLPFVKSKTARVFWEEGLKKVEDVMREGVEKVEDVLWKSLPERVRRKRDEAGDGEEGRKLAGMMRERAEIVVRAAERLWKAECEVVLDEY